MNKQYAMVILHYIGLNIRHICINSRIYLYFSQICVSESKKCVRKKNANIYYLVLISKSARLNWVLVRALAGPFKNSHRVVVKLCLAVCLGSLSCWKVNLRPSPRSRALWRRFSSRISLYLAEFIFPSIATSRPVPAAEKHPHSMMLPHHASLLGLYWTGDEQCLVFSTHTA